MQQIIPSFPLNKSSLSKDMSEIDRIGNKKLVVDETLG